MKNTQKKVSFLKKIDVIPLLLCLFSAFIIWIYVMEVDSPEYEDKFENVPITVVGTDVLKGNGLSVISQKDLTVDITVKGQKSIIRKYSASDISVTVDVSGVTSSGFSVFKLDVDVPSDINFESSSVNEVKLFIDNSATVNVDLRPKLVHWKITDDYEVGELTTDVSTIQVTGPSSVVENISYASVEVDMNLNSEDQYLTKSFTADGNVLLKNAEGDDIDVRYLKLSQSSVRVDVPVYSFKDVALRADTKYGYYNSKNAEINITPSTVRIKGEPSVINEIDSLTVTTINEKDISKDTVLTVDIAVPDGVYLASGQPESASVEVKFKNMVKRTIAVSTADFAVTGADGINYSFDKSILSVDIFGEPNDVAKISASDITVNLDLSYYKGMSGLTVYPTVDVEVKGGAFALGTYSVEVAIK